MKKTLFIISSKAGKTEFKISKDDIIETFKKANRLDEIEVIETSYKGHIKDAIDKFSKKDYGEKNAIVCGGDGSIHELINASYGKDISVGLIPMGTGNDFSKNFDFRNFNLQQTLDFQKKPIDLIRINDKYCVNVASLGFDTKVLKESYNFLEKNENLGKKAYLLAVFKSLKNISYEDLKIEIQTKDGQNIRLEDSYLISAICNGAYYGSGFNPAPKARIDDGYLNLILAEKIPLYKLPLMIMKYKNGNHQKSQHIHEYKVLSGRIYSNKDLLANMDGEIFSSKTIDFKIEKNAINFIYFS
ncbi:MAG: diacylglycerol kinase family lipid kinase [Anaerococcus sp.]|nr:diacylglycerol kinase family lipid kinase [Anaerococcus sp.]